MENKGQEGDIVTVRGGFARNYLLPRKLAGKNNLIRTDPPFATETMKEFALNSLSVKKEVNTFTI